MCNHSIHLEKIVFCDSIPEQKRKIQQVGGLDDPLPNMREISLEEFANCREFFGVQTWQFHELRWLPVGDTLLEAHVFHCYDNNGVAIASVPQEDGSQKVLFWRFAVCEHDYQGGCKDGNCAIPGVCSKCGHLNKRK